MKITVSLAVFAIAIFAATTIPAKAQLSSTGLGTATLGSSATCPTGGTSGWLPGMTCQNANISCLSGPPYNVQPLGVTYGYSTPAPPLVPQGTIVILSGQGGTSPSDESSNDAAYAADYLNDRYQVVMVQWADDWEDATNGGAGTTSNVGYAACRQYTLLHLIYSTLYASVYNATTNPTAGMCVQGESAGGGAAAFVLAWYGGTSFLDKVVLMSGPPLSRFDYGCEVPQPPLVWTVCESGQFGCNLGTGYSAWTSPMNYTGMAKNSVREWTGNQIPACGGSTNTNSTEAQSWRSMSIVDGVNATFNYPYTAMTSWLCASTASGVMMNNSSGQGEQFYLMFTGSAQVPQGYQVNGVQACPSAEGVSQGTPPNGPAGGGMAAIEADMATATQRCQRAAGRP